MAQTFGAVAQGLAHYRDDVRVHGVAANRVGGAYHVELLRRSLPADLAWLGALPGDAALALPERHLGLVVADEVQDLDTRLDALADAWGMHATTALPPPVAFAACGAPRATTDLCGVRIAIARDAAFCFLYPANLDLLREAGAELAFFSPIAGDSLPDCDAAWLPGGYPELHGAAIGGNATLRTQLHAHVVAGRPLLAECGGLLAALDRLDDGRGGTHRMLGLLPGEGAIGARLAALGSQRVLLPEGELRGHTFHFGRARIDAERIAIGDDPTGGPAAEAVYRHRRMTASFVHLYFPSAPDAALALFRP
jgi:cobyrinic acid a,c-diamide synthase